MNSLQNIRSLIEERLGLAVNTRLPTDFEALVHQLAGGQLKAYANQLRHADDLMPVWQSLIQALTIGETYFWRERGRFRMVMEELLPLIIAERRRKRDYQLTIWSAGCATGEEAYSLAIAVRESLPDFSEWQVRVLGTDLNAQALEHAKRGIYRAWSFRQVPLDFQTRYFERQNDGTWEILPEVRRMVSFEPLNLLKARMDAEVDLIFCRHVLLYLHAQATERVEKALYHALRPGGWLLMGESEALRSERERWQMHLYSFAPVYQKPLTQAQATPIIHAKANPTSSADSPIPASPAHEDAYRQALQAIRQEQHVDAERELARLLERSPQHARAHVLLAYLFANRRAIPEAQMHLNIALRHMPMLADAHYLMALVQHERGELDKARRSLEAALYCQREHTLSLWMLGMDYAQSGKLDRAQQQWRLALNSLADRAPDEYLSDLSDWRVSDLQTLLHDKFDDS
jgi:chemotaxis protein methyltransferase CheR